MKKSCWMVLLLCLMASVQAWADVGFFGGAKPPRPLPPQPSFKLDLIVEDSIGNPTLRLHPKDLAVLTGLNNGDLNNAFAQIDQGYHQDSESFEQVKLIAIGIFLGLAIMLLGISFAKKGMNKHVFAWFVVAVVGGGVSLLLIPRVQADMPPIVVADQAKALKYLLKDQSITIEFKKPHENHNIELRISSLKLGL